MLGAVGERGGVFFEQSSGDLLLPGGADGPPKGVGGNCLRAQNGTDYPDVKSPPNYSLTSTYYDFSPPTSQHVARLRVRKWAKTCTDGVAGRSVLIVRLDTGQVLRMFARSRGG